MHVYGELHFLGGFGSFGVLEFHGGEDVVVSSEAGPRFVSARVVGVEAAKSVGGGLGGIRGDVF